MLIPLILLLISGIRPSKIPISAFAPPIIVTAHDHSKRMVQSHNTYIQSCTVLTQASPPNFIQFVQPHLTAAHDQFLLCLVDVDVTATRDELLRLLYRSATRPSDDELRNMSSAVARIFEYARPWPELHSLLTEFFFPECRVYTTFRSTTKGIHETLTFEKTFTFAALSSAVDTLSRLSSSKYNEFCLHACHVDPFGLGHNVMVKLVNTADTELAEFVIKSFAAGCNLMDTELEIMERFPGHREICFSLYSKDKNGHFILNSTVEMPQKHVKNMQSNIGSYNSILLLKSQFEDALQGWRINPQKHYYPCCPTESAHDQSSSLLLTVLTPGLIRRILQLVCGDGVYLPALKVCKAFLFAAKQMSLNSVNVPRRRLYEYVVASLMTLAEFRDGHLIPEAFTMLSCLVYRDHLVNAVSLHSALNILLTHKTAYIPRHLHEHALDYSLLKLFIDHLSHIPEGFSVHAVSFKNTIQSWFSLAGLGQYKHYQGSFW